MPNFKHLCNSIPELLNVFEDPAQHVHTIVYVRLVCVCAYLCVVCLSVFNPSPMQTAIDLSLIHHQRM